MTSNDEMKKMKEIWSLAAQAIIGNYIDEINDEQYQAERDVVVDKIKRLITSREKRVVKKLLDEVYDKLYEHYNPVDFCYIEEDIEELRKKYITEEPGKEGNK